MTEDTVVRGKNGSTMTVVKIVLGVLAMGLASVLGFVGSNMTASIDSLKDEARGLGSRIQDLEGDRSRWGTLAEIKEESVNLKVENAYNRGRTDTIMQLITSGVVEVERTEEGPVVLPTPKPLPDAQRINPEDFRRIQQQKYPSKPK